MALTAVVVLPLLAALLCWIPMFRKAAWVISVVCLCADFVLAIVVAGEVVARAHVTGIPGWLEADGLSALMVLLVSFVCALAAVFAGDYMRHDEEHVDRLWWFYCNYNLLAFALIVVPALADPNLVWVGVELITLFAILLVGFETTSRALEAAWKYSVLTMMGAPISLLGFLVLYWGYHSTGASAPETWTSLLAHSRTMSPELLRLSFLLVFVGFGSKIGFAPMHTWLPDAHSQAPSPVCAVLSGVKTSVPLYAVLRFLSIVLASPTARMGRWMIVMGLISVAIAAFLLLQVREYKRMFAYSTVEHMGIVLTAAGFATQSSDFGAVSQMLNHSITKSLCFYVAGTILVTLTTREIKSVRGLIRVSPFSGAALLLCALAIAGAPPFPIFLSEFAILGSGLRAGHPVAVGILGALIVIAFIGIMMHVNRMVFGVPDPKPMVPKARPPLTCRVSVLAAALPVVVLGVYIPGALHSLLSLAAQQLGGR
ncbi:MAG TPA: proton-conducting transporter membrane subunit [Terriglobales bacterium]|jgi:hydrogenase-4 component F|nr:proton-conducting transporter membrane subunit [Terriglobales bacterium]